MLAIANMMSHESAREDHSSKGTPGKTHNSVSSNEEHATRNLLYSDYGEK